MTKRSAVLLVLCTVNVMLGIMDNGLNLIAAGICLATITYIESHERRRMVDAKDIDADRIMKDSGYIIAGGKDRTIYTKDDQALRVFRDNIWVLEPKTESVLAIIGETEMIAMAAKMAQLQAEDSDGRETD